MTTISMIPSTYTRIEEENNSLFTAYAYRIAKVQVVAGLRYEHVRSNYFNDDERIDEQSSHYAQWFPSLSLSTELGGVDMQLSYTAKTKRPTYSQLRSNIFYANRFTMQTGNPFLKPVTIHDLSFTSAWRWIQLMVNYKNERDAIIFWTEQMKENEATALLTLRNLERLLTEETGYLTSSSII